MAARSYAQKEWRLLSWWLATYHPQAEIYMQVRLGPTSPLEGANLLAPPPDGVLRLRNRWADAIIVENGLPSIIEAKIEPDPGVFSTLVHYLRKFRVDPAWATYAEQPVGLIAVVYNNDASVAQEAAWYGVQWVNFQPDLSGFPQAVTKGNPAIAWGSGLPASFATQISALSGRELASS